MTRLLRLLVLGSAISSLASPAFSQLSLLSDEFDDAASVVDWQRFYATEGWPDKMAVLDVDQTAPGALYVEPSACGWFNDLHAPFLFKEVTGDFVMEARILAEGRNGPVPTRNFSLVGLFARAPRSITKETWTPGGEDWMFLSVGRGTQAGVLTLEDKTTDDSQSTLRLTPLPVLGWVELRMTRQGDVFQLDYRIAPADWVEHQTFVRPDMPQALQLGVTAYADWPSISQYEPNPMLGNCQVVTGNADLVATVDYVRFSDPGVTAADVRSRGDLVVHGAVPNPFNPRTLVGFELGREMDMEVTVYTLRGRQVRQLLAGRLASGVHEIPWDGRDDSGRPAASGTYRISVSGDGLRQSTTVTLVK